MESSGASGLNSQASDAVPKQVERPRANALPTNETATADWLSSNPVGKIKMPPSSPARDRRLGDVDFDRLEEAAKQTKNPNIWPIIVFAVEIGMRRGEILGL